jgi:hypothetical protein
MECWQILSACAEVVSLDNNMIAKQARRGLAWQRQRGKTSHWWLLRDLGDDRADGVPLECFRRSLRAVKDRWDVYRHGIVKPVPL